MRTTSLLPGLIALFGAACVEPTEDSSSEELQAAPLFGGDVANHALFAADVSVWETPLAQSEMDCFWDSGVRHVVVGTQDAAVAREQLAMAVSRGMTVDAYVYLYWDQDITAQVNAAFAMVQGFPVGRMWLDIEADPKALGSTALIAMIQQGLTTCAAHSPVGCGIYSGPGWWKSYVANTNAFDATPLWYALYNHKRSLSDWPTEQFGHWTSPVGKQFQTAPLCGVGGADWDILQVAATPTVVVDRTPPPDTNAPPVAPTNLFPQEGAVVAIDYAKLMSGTVPRATLYQLALEHYTGTAWTSYYTWSSPNAFVKVTPPSTPALYRFRVRAQNAHGWGAWSDYASFDYGTYAGPRPSGTTTPPPTTTPPTAAVPGSLAPDGGVTFQTASVALSCGPVTSATTYQFAVEDKAGATWAAYYTYTSAGTAVTYYPQIRNADYRFRVRAQVGGVYGAWSSYATFHVQ